MMWSWLVRAQWLLFGLQDWQYEVPVAFPVGKVEQAFDAAERAPSSWFWRRGLGLSVPLVMRRDRSGNRYLQTEPVRFRGLFGFGDRAYLTARAVTADACLVVVHQQTRTYQRVLMTVLLVLTWSIVVVSLVAALRGRGLVEALTSLVFPLVGRGLLIGVGRHLDQRQIKKWLRHRGRTAQTGRETWGANTRTAW